EPIGPRLSRWSPPGSPFGAVSALRIGRGGQVPASAPSEISSVASRRDRVLDVELRFQLRDLRLDLLLQLSASLLVQLLPRRLLRGALRVLSGRNLGLHVD